MFCAGNIDIVEWTCHAEPLSPECSINNFTASVLQPAATFGHLHILEWAVGGQNGRADLSSACPSEGLWSTHIHVLEWADRCRLPRHVMTAVKAAETGSLQLIRWGFHLKIGDLNWLTVMYVVTPQLCTCWALRHSQLISLVQDKPFFTVSRA